MQKQQTNLNHNQLYSQLIQLGFQEQYVLKAISMTHDIQKASLIALKLADQGPFADLSQFIVSPKPIYIPQESPKIQISPFSRAKMLFIVNGQLKMGKGKICAQVGHAVIGTYIQVQEQARYQPKSKARLSNWQSFGSAKIVVKTQSQKEMLEIKQKIQKLGIGINTHLVRDAGHTQIKAGSMTVLGIGPAFPEEIDPITQHLKLL